MELNKLPDEVLMQIFSYLPIDSLADVARLILVCKKWHQILWSNQFIQRIISFKYQSRFLIYRWPIYDNMQQNSFSDFVQFDSDSNIPHLTINGDVSKLKQDIENCPLINMIISLWCRTLTDCGSVLDRTSFLLWHFHLGYVGFYRDRSDKGCARVKCTYTRQHELNTTFHMKLNEWYHIAIVINENKNLQLWINGNKIDQWPLQENINRQNLSIAPYSSVWFGSHCGRNAWDGSLFDICVCGNVVYNLMK